MKDFETVRRMMLGGEIYDARHPRLLEKLGETRAKIKELNDLHPAQEQRKQEILRELLGGCGERLHINLPFRCDYGENIFVGENFFANFNLTILDEARVVIGDNAFIGPNVGIYTACHPLNAAERNSGVQWAKEVRIGNDVWLGANVVITPGVSIGNGVVVGAGAVVTGDLPDNVVAAGVPARIIRSIEQ